MRRSRSPIAAACPSGDYRGYSQIRMKRLERQTTRPFSSTCPELKYRIMALPARSWARSPKARPTPLGPILLQQFDHFIYILQFVELMRISNTTSNSSF